MSKISANSKPSTAIVHPSTQPHLYADLLHTIHSFLLPSNPDRSNPSACRELVSAALTCHEWFDAATTMRPSSYHDSKTIASRIVSAATSRLFSGHSKIHARARFSLLAASRLRNLVTSLRYDAEDENGGISLEEFVLHAHEVHLATRLAHVHTMTIALRVDANGPEKVDQLQDIDRLLLPPALRSLTLQISFSKNYIDAEDEGDSQEQNKVRIYKRIAHCMRILAEGVRSISSSVNSTTLVQLTHLKIELNFIDRRIRSFYLPACALEPWSSIESLRYLIIERPTFQCVDLARTIMQLHRIDGLQTVSSLQRFIFGSSQAAASMVPPLQYFHIEYPYAEIVELASHLHQLTHLRCDWVYEDPGEVLLAKLPHLQSFICSVDAECEFLSETLLESIATHAPQLRHVEIDHNLLTDEELIEFLPRMYQLESLSLKNSNVSSLECFTSAPSSLTRLDLEDILIESKDELQHIRHITKVNLKNCDRNWRWQESEETPPAERLIGIELNPGPHSGTSSSSPASGRLYMDVIHMIYSFILSASSVDSEKYLIAFHHFIALASASKLWYQAALTFKFATTHDVDGTPLPIQPLHLSLDAIGSLTRSQLRHLVRGVDIKLTSLSAVFLLIQMQFGARMSHLHHLDMYVQLEPVAPSSLPNAILLPASLRALDFVISTKAIIAGSVKWDETRFPLYDPIRQCTYSQIENLMRIFASSAHLCPQLSFLGIRSQSNSGILTLPACALQPWSQLSSLQTASLASPTLQCIDLLSTMSQLTRIDQLVDDFIRFSRFIVGESFHDDPDAAHYQPRLSLPPISFVSVQHPDLEQFRLLACLPTITELHLEMVRFRPGEVLFARLPHLTRLSLMEPPLIMVTLLEIVNYAPRVTQLTITHKRLTEQEMANFLLQMPQLQSLTIGLSSKILRLSFLSQVHTPSLRSLNLHNLRSIASQNELDHIRHIPRVTMKNCEFVQNMQPLPATTTIPPQARLVGVELNPGPSATVNSLYDDVLHSIFTFLYNNSSPAPHFDVARAGLTCHRWLSAASTMKISYDHELPHVNYKQLYIGSDTFTLRTQSRLRNLVAVIVLNDQLLPAGALLYLHSIQFDQRMSHLHTLSLILCVNVDQSIRKNNTTVKLMRSIRLPLNLRDLSFFLVGSVYPGCDQADEAVGLTPDQLVERNHTYEEVQAIMCIFAQAAHVPQIEEAVSSDEDDASEGSVSRLTRLRIGLRVINPRYRRYFDALLPACALAPWSRVKSLRHLIIEEPTRQCVDLMRTMYQLNRIEELKSELLLQRFIFGPFPMNEGEIDPSTTNVEGGVPQLRSYTFESASPAKMNLIAHFTQLTHLECKLTFDSIDSLLCKLTHLISLKCTVKKHQNHVQTGLLTSIASHSSKLHHLTLSAHPILTSDDLLVLLPRMAQLESLTLEECKLITTLSWSKVAPPSLVRLNLRFLPIVSPGELIHIQHIRYVDLKHCDWEWPTSTAQSPVSVDSAILSFLTPPAAPLVGVELNSGPYS